MREQPQAAVADYFSQLMLEVNLEHGDHWSLADCTATISWGKKRGLHRVHFHATQILSLMLKRQHAQAEAYMVQLLRSLHQVVLDQGNWSVAMHLMPRADPIERPTFGETQRELETIAAHTEALRRLRRQQAAAGDGNEDDEAKKGNFKKNKKGDGRGKDASAGN